MRTSKDLEDTVDSAGALADQASEMRREAESAHAAASKPVDLTDPIWHPIDGITLDKYAQLTAALARQDLGTRDETQALARGPRCQARYLGGRSDGVGQPHVDQRSGAHPLRDPLQPELTTRRTANRANLWLARPRFAAAAPVLRDSRTLMRSAWPLVGRTEILDQARQDLRRGDLSGVILAGPAGVGKTRLAAEIAEHGAAAGFHVERAIASQSARGIPFGALAPLLPPAALAVERGIAMLGQATEALMQRSGGQRFLLLVDDAQWLDDASALLFQQLVSARTVFAVASVRTGEPAPDAVQAVWKNGLCDRVDVGPLNRAETKDLLEQVLGGQVEGAALQQLWDASEGNLQYLRELVLAGVDAGTLVDDAGLWRTVGAISPSERLQDLVGERLAGLDDDEVATLELVAFGEPLGVDVLAGLVGSDALVRLERKGLVETAMDGRRFEATLAHPVHGEVVRERTPLTRARQVQRQLADAVESHDNRRRIDVLKVALWRVEAGGSTSPELLIAAARQAGFAHDLQTALRLANAAHDIEATFASGQIIADSLYSLGRSDETEQRAGRAGGRGRRRQPAGHPRSGPRLQPVLARR